MISDSSYDFLRLQGDFADSLDVLRLPGGDVFEISSRIESSDWGGRQVWVGRITSRRLLCVLSVLEPDVVLGSKTGATCEVVGERADVAGKEVGP